MAHRDRKYPRLTEIGSKRSETLVGRYDKNRKGVYDGKPYGGFYTQDDIREIVRYAAERHIEVIPEIEMPGHGLAALTSIRGSDAREVPYSYGPTGESATTFTAPARRRHSNSSRRRCFRKCSTSFPRN